MLFRSKYKQCYATTTFPYKAITWREGWVLRAHKICSINVRKWRLWWIKATQSDAAFTRNSLTLSSQLTKLRFGGWGVGEGLTSSPEGAMSSRARHSHWLCLHVLAATYIPAHHGVLWGAAVLTDKRRTELHLEAQAIWIHHMLNHTHPEQTRHDVLITN